MKFSIGKEYTENDLGEDYVHCEIVDQNNGSMMKCEIVCTNEFLYVGQNLNNDFKDLSKIKIYKKIPWRYLVIKVPLSDDSSLELYDSDQANKKCIYVNCLCADNAPKMLNYLLQQKSNSVFLEYALFNTYIDNLKNKIKNY